MTAYQKYQLQWMIAHGHSLQELIEELTEFQYDDPEDSDRISTPISELFDEWEFNSGFGSEIWVCEAEWEDSDGKEPAKKISYTPLRKMMSERGMNFADLGRLCGFSAGTRVALSHDKNVQLDVIKRICEAMNCSVADVMEIK